jgi:hypothetical protein
MNKMIKQSTKVILGLLMLVFVSIGYAGDPTVTYTGTIVYFHYEQAGNGNWGWHMGIDTDDDGIADINLWIDPSTINEQEMNLIQGVVGGETVVTMRFRLLYQDVPNWGLESIRRVPMPVPPSFKHQQ